MLLKTPSHFVDIVIFANIKLCSYDDLAKLILTIFIILIGQYSKC